MTPVPLDRSFDLDTGAMLREEGQRPSITFISYPNNPTGNCFSEEALTEILNRAEGVVVVDEAYFDYSRKTFIDRLEDYPNLIILRTLSKVGLASLRLGALVASDEIIDTVNRVRLPYNIGSMQQLAAIAAFKLRGDIDAGINEVINERDRVCAAMSDLESLEIFRSDSNFVFFRVSDADETFRGLIDEGVLIRNLNSDGALKNCLRVTIGTTPENNSFLKAITRVNKA